MTPTAYTISSLFCGSAATSVGLLAQAGGDDLGKVLAGGGSAALVTFLFVWVLRHYSLAQKERDAVFAEAMKHAADQHAAATVKFAETIESRGQACDETVATLLREARESHEARERVLIETLKEFRKP